MNKLKAIPRALAIIAMILPLAFLSARAEPFAESAVPPEQAGSGAPLPPASGLPISQPASLVAAPAAAGQPLPNQRELSEAEYAVLGRIVWQRLQSAADPSRPELTEAEIQELLDQMQRNRNEVLLTLDDLHAIMNSSALCGGANRPMPTPGVDVDRAGKFLQRLFE